MKTTKIIEVLSETTKAPTKEVTLFYCDMPDCKEEVKPYTYGWGKIGHKCLLCNRDICRKHIAYDPQSSDDYPDHYCDICAIPYFPLRDLMQQRHEQEEEELANRIKKESLNVK